ncbi:MAG TPA: V-type ATP synthase subunit D [Bacillota bacterium]|jgi:V/A-type H+-transporting ATPase subunit D|nr:V-type ATP synthase subunit D [Fastidiosipila sp.]HPX92750.1 V-type ATP synthase subunit D [Bacillota bacterium]HQB80647.1 V-type ATP synthase subunit D [Bacillota bacterium]
MALMRVNPNRMELLRLKAQLRIARRGHKLLKDKRDELMRQFLVLVLEVDALRRKTETIIERAHREMMLARAVNGPQVVDGALMADTAPLCVTVGRENTMSVRTPLIRYPHDPEGEKRPIELPYGLASVTGELDVAIDSYRQSLPLMMKLAGLEHKVHLMAAEIERTRRRVNSLEYVMIPSLEETIRTITMKMDENERGNLTRLMKVKDMIVEQEIKKRQDQAEERRRQRI